MILRLSAKSAGIIYGCLSKKCLSSSGSSRGKGFGARLKFRMLNDKKNPTTAPHTCDCHDTPACGTKPAAILPPYRNTTSIATVSALRSRRNMPEPTRKAASPYITPLMPICTVSGGASSHTSRPVSRCISTSTTTSCTTTNQCIGKIRTI